MTNNQMGMTKLEIAQRFNIDIEDITKWPSSSFFEEWFDVCSNQMDKIHDEDDIYIFTYIHEINNQINDEIAFLERKQQIEENLNRLDRTRAIKNKRTLQKHKQEIRRWKTINIDICSKYNYNYEWLKPLQVSTIANFGCCAAENTPVSEPYILLWVLEATKIVVIDKNPQFIHNAQSWVNMTQQNPQTAYFKDYNLEFVVGDMTDKDLAETIKGSNQDGFDLSYCHSVLYNMYDYRKTTQEALQEAINTMAKVVKPGGWVVAKECVVAEESKVGNECQDISQYFEAAGLVKYELKDMPDFSYCYQKPH